MSIIQEEDTKFDSFEIAHPPLIRKLFASCNAEEENKDLDSDTFKVFLRIKPKSDLGHSNDCIRIESTKVICKPPPSSKFKKLEKVEYTFSHIFGPKTPQSDIFSKCIVACVEDLIMARNSLIFSYGTTNAGKTFTVQGTEKCPGIIPRSLYTLFSNINIYHKLYYKPFLAKDVMKLSRDTGEEEIRIKNEILRSFQTSKVSKSNYQDPSQVMLALQNTFIDLKIDKPACSVWISFVEVYNESVYDLLDSSTTIRRALKIAADSEDNFYVKELKHIYVGSAEDAFTIYQYGKKNLNVASTKMNENSSRSHCVFTIHVINMNNKNEPSVSKLCICDLAGTERLGKTQNTGMRLKESGSINGSLFQLNRCLRAIRENQTRHTNQLIPYRHSSLTKLLHSALDDRTDEKIIMIVNINPAAELYDETQQVLKMCAIASKIKNKPITQTFPRSSRFMSLVYGKENTAEDNDRNHSDELSDCQDTSKHFDDETDVQELLEKLLHQDTEINRLKQQIEFIEEHNKTSKKNLQDYINKVEETYKRKVTRLEDRLKSQKKFYLWKVDEVKKNTFLESADETIRSELVEKNARIEELESKLTELLRKDDSTNRNSVRASLSNTAIREELSMKDIRIEELEKKISELDYQLQNKKLFLSEEINKRDNRIKELEFLTLEAKEQYLFLEKKYETGESKINELEDELYGKNEIIDLLGSRFEECEQKMESLEETLYKNTIEHEQILKIIENTRDRSIAELEKKIEEFRSENEDLKTKIVPAKNNEIEQLKNEINELESSKDGKISRLRTKIEFLRKENIDQRNEIEDLKKGNSDLRNKIEDLKKENSDQRNKIEDLKKENVDRRNEIEDLKKEKIDLAKLREVEELENEIMELHGHTPKNEKTSGNTAMGPIVHLKALSLSELAELGEIEELEEEGIGLHAITPKNEESNEKIEVEAMVRLEKLKLSNEKKPEIPQGCLMTPEVSEKHIEENTTRKRYNTRGAYKTPARTENTPNTKTRKGRGKGKTPLGMSYVSELDDSSEANIFRNTYERGKTPQPASKIVKEIFPEDAGTPTFHAPRKIKLSSFSPSPELNSLDSEPSSRDESRRVEMSTPHQTVKMMMKKKKRY